LAKRIFSKISEVFDKYSFIILLLIATILIYSSITLNESYVGSFFGREVSEIMLPLRLKIIMYNYNVREGKNSTIIVQGLAYSLYTRGLQENSYTIVNAEGPDLYAIVLSLTGLLVYYYSKRALYKKETGQFKRLVLVLACLLLVIISYIYLAIYMQITSTPQTLVTSNKGVITLNNAVMSIRLGGKAYSVYLVKYDVSAPTIIKLYWHKPFIALKNISISNEYTEVVQEEYVHTFYFTREDVGSNTTFILLIPQDYVSNMVSKIGYEETILIDLDIIDKPTYITLLATPIMIQLAIFVLSFILTRVSKSERNT